MAKKGKRSRTATATDVDTAKANLESSRKRIRDFTDVADSDDEFHLNRDEVLLGERPEAKRRRKWAEQEEFLEDSGSEILAVDGDDEEDDGIDQDEDEDDDDDDDGLHARCGSQDGDEEEEGWGVSRDDMYGADEIETEEQALEEEKEALRLQQKQLKAMSAADYGFDEDEWQGTEQKENSARENGGVATVTEVLPQLQIDDGMSASERLTLLQTRHPEFEPLRRELLRITEIHKTIQKEMQQRNTTAVSSLGIQLHAAASYLGSLAMYFALMCSPAGRNEVGAMSMAPSQLRDHPVMDSLVRCRDLWLRAQKLPIGDDPDASEEDTSFETTVSHMTEQHDIPDVTPRVQIKSRAQRHAEAMAAQAQARRAERLKRTEAGLADLDDLLSRPVQNRSSKSKAEKLVSNDADLDLGEDTPLTAAEAAENARRRKSLRFYTSQIAQKANKRGAAGRHAGGDDDLPYRERLRDRQARLNAEAEKRGERRKDANAGADLGGESDDEDLRQAQELRAAADEDDDGYYDLVASRAAKKKGDKLALAQAQREATLQGGRLVPEETVGADGKRKITYAIEKNKGLTPHRKKDVRNPRVKKRKKFEEKKKKLGSIRPVFKGGEGRGGYGGEMTGIKKGLVKSTKF